VAKRAVSELIALAGAEPLPKDAVSRAAAALDDPDPEIRAAAIDAIGRLAAFREAAIEETITKRIVDRTKDDDHRVRAEAASALAMLPAPPEGAARAVRLLLEDPHSRVRQEACAALGDLGDSVSRDFLAARLDDDDPEVRFEAAFALASLKDARGRNTLESALAGTRKRLDACEGLRRLGDPAAVEALEKMAGKMFSAWVDRLSAWATMVTLGRSDVAGKVIERTASKSREERTYALSLIGSHRIAAGREVLEKVARDARDPLRDTAVRALGDLGEQASIATLREIIGGSDRNLASDAEAALRKIQSRSK
jgi:HEAT repeat protein